MHCGRQHAPETCCSRQARAGPIHNDARSTSRRNHESACVVEAGGQVPCRHRGGRISEGVEPIRTNGYSECCSDDEACTAFRATGAQDLATAYGLHTGAKTVGALALDHRGLVSTFHVSSESRKKPCIRTVFRGSCQWSRRPRSRRSREAVTRIHPTNVRLSAVDNY